MAFFVLIKTFHYVLFLFLYYSFFDFYVTVQHILISMSVFNIV